MSPVGLALKVLPVSALFLVLAAPPNVRAVELPGQGEGTLRVMTYNLRFASPNPPNAWPARRPLMRQCILGAAPDIIGTQEGLYSQLKDLAADLSDYQWIGLGRDGGSKGEFMAVFYRKSRLDPLAFDHFWFTWKVCVFRREGWYDRPAWKTRYCTGFSVCPRVTVPPGRKSNTAA